MQICQIWKRLLIDARYVNTPEYSISTIFNYSILHCFARLQYIWWNRCVNRCLKSTVRTCVPGAVLRRFETMSSIVNAWHWTGWFFSDVQRPKLKHWSTNSSNQSKHRKAKQKKDPKDPTEHSKDSTLKNIFSRIEIKTGGPLNFGPSNILYIYNIYISYICINAQSLRVSCNIQMCMSTNYTCIRCTV